MIDELLCPVCGQPNPSDLKVCQVCGAKLTPPDPQSIPPGQEPVKKDTAEFEKVKPTNAGEVHPGEAPTKKNTAELEKALPTWLRSLRENKDAQEGESTSGSSAEENLPLGPKPSTPDDGLPDWLSGLGKAAADDSEDEIPDWLAGLHSNNAGASTPPSTPGPEPASSESENQFSGLGGLDRLSRQEPEPPAAEPEQPGPQPTPFDQPSQESAPLGELPEWLKALESQPPAEEEPPARADSMTDLGSSGRSQDQGPVVPQGAGENLEWLSNLPGIPEVGTPEDAHAESAAPAENMPDWLNQLSEKGIPVIPGQGETEEPGVTGESVPDWLSEAGTSAEPGSSPEETATTGGENIPDWLANLEAKAGPGMGTSSALSGSEPTPSSDSQNAIPDWLSQFSTGINAAETEAGKPEEGAPLAEEPAAKPGAAPLPDWLAGLRPSGDAAEESKPAFLANEETGTPADQNAAAFSVEMPDWLSNITPEQAAEKTSRGDSQALEPTNQDLSSLPSWVQAMRPVESVVSEAKATPQESAGVTEQSGPLAGLRGVLPVAPGLGQLSKPPAYSIKLKASEGQQRYAAALERLVASETHPQEIAPARIVSTRVWRWIISIVLIAAISLPLITRTPITPASQLKPPEMINAFTLIGSLTPNSAVLVVFDYDPALSGEVEAAAAPLMDHLLFQGPRLTLISTSPTGPALAERFLHDTRISPLVAGHDYQSGQQYVNLGYLAGGPSGIQFFAQSPTTAAPFTLDGQRAWQQPPLQGIQKLSDFAAVLVLTDNADTGRAWVEQTSTAIGSSPMLMVISAQAEPMLLPYYDSGQIKGLVTGLAGGEYYAQTFLRPDGLTEPVQYYWNSFSVGILVAVILVVLGALWSVLSGWLARSKKKGEGA